jgi:hypothetical protein
LEAFIRDLRKLGVIKRYREVQSGLFIALVARIDVSLEPFVAVYAYGSEAT